MRDEQRTTADDLLVIVGPASGARLHGGPQPDVGPQLHVDQPQRLGQQPPPLVLDVRLDDVDVDQVSSRSGLEVRLDPPDVDQPSSSVLEVRLDPPDVDPPPPLELEVRLDGPPTATMQRRWLRSARQVRLPGWLVAITIFAAGRGITFVFVQGLARFQPANRFTVAHPDYLQMAGNWWDAGRYQSIATLGYPVPLPRYADGTVMRNQWAFYPAYPRLVRQVMNAFDVPWAIAGVTVSLVCGVLAVIVMHSLVDRVAGRSLATWTVVLFCCFPSSAVLQFTYTESLALLLVVSVLWCLQRGWYLPAVPVVLVAGFTRPIGLPLAALILVHLLVRGYQRLLQANSLGSGSLGSGSLTSRSLGWLVLLAVAGCLAAVEWPLLVGRLTGDPEAYAETMAAWRTSGKIIPVRPWIDEFSLLLGQRVGPATLVVAALGYLAWLGRRSGRVIGADLLTWCLVYPAYLVAVLDPSTSLVRYLLLLFPLGTLLLAASPSVAYRRLLAVSFLASQLFWLGELWMIDPQRVWPP